MHTSSFIQPSAALRLINDKYLQQSTCTFHQIKRIRHKSVHYPYFDFILPHYIQNSNGKLFQNGKFSVNTRVLLTLINKKHQQSTTALHHFNVCRSRPLVYCLPYSFSFNSILMPFFPITTQSTVSTNSFSSKVSHPSFFAIC